MSRIVVAFAIVVAMIGSVAIGRAALGASAQEDTADLAGHPLTGTWLAMANPPLPDDPQIAVPSLFGADGSVLLMFPLTQAGRGASSSMPPASGPGRPTASGAATSRPSRCSPTPTGPSSAPSPSTATRW